MSKINRRKTRSQPLPFPVSKEATQAALNRVIGGQSTDEKKYREFQGHLQTRQTSFLPMMKLMGIMKNALLTTSRFQESSYMGGAFIYLASVEEQARLNGTKLRSIAEETYKQAATQDLFTVGGAEPLNNILTMFGNEFSAEDMRRLQEAESKSVPRLLDELRVNEASMLVSSPFAEQNAETLQSAEPLARTALAYRLGQFAAAEQPFIGVMNDFWWDKMHPKVSSSQLMGAADTQGVIQLHYQR